MALFQFMMTALAAQAAPVAVDVAKDDLVAGRDSAAIATIMANENLEESDPARLINLGIAHARQGETELARRLFEAALQSDEPVFLETAGGDWISAQRLARRAIAMLDGGVFAQTTLVASRR